MCCRLLGFFIFVIVRETMQCQMGLNTDLVNVSILDLKTDLNSLWGGIGIDLIQQQF